MAFGKDRAEADTALASWYGPGLHGQLTASGDVYNAYGYTAAHETLPFGTELTVSYAGRSVNVVINDRGPYSGGRDLDLSQGAAEYIGLTGARVDYVDYEIAGSGGYAGNYAANDQYAAETGYAADGGYKVKDHASQGSGAAGYAAKYEDGRSGGGGSGGGGSGGQVASGGSYVVQFGDTLTGIAADLGMGVDQLMADNGIADPDVIFAGQTLEF